MQAVLSLVSGALMIGLVYGLSFIPTATLPRPDDEVGVGMIDGDGAAPGVDPADIPPDSSFESDATLDRDRA